MPLVHISKFGHKTIWAVILLTALAGLTDVAADSAVVNNLSILPGYLEYFQVDANLLGLNAAVTSGGYVVAGPFAGYIIDRIGRRRSLMASFLLTMVGTAICASAPVEAAFVVGRFLLGVAFLISGTAATLYVAELAPPDKRQTMTGFVLGASAFVTTLFSLVVLGIYKLDTDWAWRGYTLSEMVSPIFGLLLVQIAPESPRWLCSQGRTEEALDVIAVLHGKGDRNHELVQLEFQEIRVTIEAEKQASGSWKSLVSPAPNLRRFGISVLIGIFYQMMGCGSLFYFMSILLQNLGIEDIKHITLINWGLGLWTTTAMVVGGATIERFGRKTMLLVGTVVMSICMLIVGLIQRQLEFGVTMGLSVGAVFVIFVYSFVACTGWQILVYSYPNEILSFNQRAKGSAIVQSIGWAFSFIYLYCFPIALQTITWRFFIANATWTLAFAVVIWFVVVETKGKTLEEIDEIFEKDAAVTLGVHVGVDSDHQSLAGSLDTDTKTPKYKEGNVKPEVA